MLKYRDASECRYDIVSLGEVMLRLDPGEGRIHTARDTILDEENVNYLRDTLLTLADVNAAQ